MLNNISNEFVEYHILQGNYIKMMLQKEEYKGYNELQYQLLFPSDWFGNSNYTRKIELLKIAIAQNKCIVDMEESIEFNEGIRHK